jgi:hypothetical protein
MPEICPIDLAGAIHIAYGVCVRRAPLRQQDAEVCAVGLIVNEQIRKALAGIRNRVVVKVRYAGSELTHVTYAVAIAVSLRWVCDGGAVVGGVGATVAIGVDGW